MGNIVMKRLIVTFAIACLIGPAAAFAFDGSAGVRDVCRKQINAYVEQNLGTTVRSIQFDFDPEDHIRSNNLAWTRVESCSGYVVFRLRANEADCENVHYGRIPNYITDVWTTGDCR